MAGGSDPRPTDPLATTRRVEDGAFDTDRTPPSLPTTFLERYQIKRKIGSGGMGVVYEALDVNLHRVVALKVLKLDDRDPAKRAEAANRLVREARAMAVLSHRNVVTVYDVGVYEEQVYVAMQLVDGMTLRQWLTSAARSTSDILRVVCDAGAGLAAAHSARLVHRDFKPDNVLVSRRGTARVTDFGLARRATFELDDTQPERTSQPKVVDVSDVDSVTRSGAILGTPAYMPPEQTEGRLCDARADQFSFCVTTWEALFGTRPYAGETWSAIYSNLMAGDIAEPPTGHRVPRQIEKALRRGLAIDPAQRFATMDELLAILETGIVKRKPRLRYIVVPVASAAIAVAGTWLIKNEREPARPSSVAPIAAAPAPPPPPATSAETPPITAPPPPSITSAPPTIAKVKPRVEPRGEPRKSMSASAASTSPPPPATSTAEPKLAPLRAKRKALEAALRNRGLRSADLPHGTMTALADADDALTAGDAALAETALQSAERAIDAIVIDYAFINAKLARINKQLAQSSGREEEFRTLYAKLKTLVQAKQYVEANALLNDMADRLAKR